MKPLVKKNNKITDSKVSIGFSLVSKTLLLLLAISLVSCSFNKINTKNSLVQQDANSDEAAKVYFIRPMPFKYKGIADNTLTVALNNEPLLKINEGQYTLVRIKPSKVHVVTHSKTMFTNKFQPINVTRTREYQFLAGKTYFIELKRINEEFRGIYYDPASVNLEQAKQLSEHLTALGDARREPIRSLTSVAEAPPPGPLAPALPENLYTSQPYMIKKDPVYKSSLLQQQDSESTEAKPDTNTAPQPEENPNPEDKPPANDNTTETSPK